MQEGETEMCLLLQAEKKDMAWWMMEIVAIPGQEKPQRSDILQIREQKII